MPRIIEFDEDTGDESEARIIRVFDKVYQYLFCEDGRVHRRLLPDGGPVSEWEELIVRGVEEAEMR